MIYDNKSPEFDIDAFNAQAQAAIYAGEKMIWDNFSTLTELHNKLDKRRFITFFINRAIRKIERQQKVLTIVFPDWDESYGRK